VKIRRLAVAIQKNYNVREKFGNNISKIYYLSIMTGSSWQWSYGCYIYNYLCNQSLSPLVLWIRISIRARCATLCDKVCQWLEQVGGFLRVLRFPPPNCPSRYNWNIVESGVKHHQANKQTSKWHIKTVNTPNNNNPHKTWLK
jgi:hypothetical protein